MSWSFRTNGNFIDFVHTDETSLAVENTIVSLHNTSKCVDWSLPEDTTRISFTINEAKYSNILITDIDFDGTQMNSQDDFETGIEAMFPGLAGGSSGYLNKVVVTLTNDEIKALPDWQAPFVIIDNIPADKGLLPVVGFMNLNTIASGYGNVAAAVLGGITIMEIGGFGIVPSSEMLDFQATGFKQLMNLRPNQIALGPDDPEVLNESADVYGTRQWMGKDIVTSQLRMSVSNYSADWEEDLGNFTGGDPANTMTITIFYVEVDI